VKALFYESLLVRLYSDILGELGMHGKLTLEGIITALVTPFSPNGEVDESSLRELVRFQLKSQVNGLYPLGTTGLGPIMPTEQRKRVAEIAVEEAGHRIPVIIQVGAADSVSSLELALHAQKIGADAVASLTPFYYQPGEPAIIEYFTKLSEATALPLLVYNIPRNTGNNVNADLLVKLSKLPHVCGIKDSSRDFSQLLDYIQKVPQGFHVINGTDSYLFSAFCAGAHAGVSATANAFPELFVEMYRAFRTNDFEKGKILQLKIHAIRQALSSPPIAPILEALRLRGFHSGMVKTPLRSMTAEEIENLRSQIASIVPDIRLAS
jgi:4-hydroxy-tetrahydrodipicolinate synthase